MSFFRQYNKRIAVLLSLLLFVFASGYTCIYSLSKSITVKINERHSSYDSPKVNTISNVNMNKTLEEVLIEHDIPIDDNYVYDTDLSTKIREVDTLTMDRKVDGTLKADNEIVSFTSGAATVGDLLKEYNIRVSPSDIIEPKADTPLSSDTSNIVIYRQTQQREKREEAISYETIQTQDSNLLSGTVEVDIPGIEGKKLVTEDVKYRDGMAVSRNLVDEEILLAPTNQVERVGTRQPSSSNSAASSSSGNRASASSAGNNVTVSGNVPNRTLSENTAPAVSSLEPAAQEPQLSSSGPGDYNGTGLSQEDFDLVCAIVEHEGGSNYEGALAVMSCVMNRIDAGGYGDDPVSVLTAPGQFASYLNGYYRQFLGNSSILVRQAVKDCLNGKRSHNYLNFRSYETSGSEQIGGNWFFND